MSKRRAVAPKSASDPLTPTSLSSVVASRVRVAVVAATRRATARPLPRSTASSGHSPEWRPRPTGWRCTTSYPPLPQRSLPTDSDRSVTLCTLLPMAWPALVRDNGDVMLAAQTQTSSADVGRDLGDALSQALAGRARNAHRHHVRCRRTPRTSPT